ncbi:hypothetical protein KIPB_003238 [Kipferlia bialata]|uniref:Uncharacterized protein n=1 Tax=Kipferlia bialata TaxID=797122 RepID=A0A9K3GGW6_9EUKA|nr:hypothetical protein KIPB_003238 [Kipferlia bialata]|eukprot:g3238.t1
MLCYKPGAPKRRVLSLDLLRGIAVLSMEFGHTLEERERDRQTDIIMDGEPWHTRCSLAWGVNFFKKRPRDLSLVTIGHNTAMLTYTMHKGGPKQIWNVLTLEEGQLNKVDIPGPSNPQGIIDIQLCRVGEVVVAYGGQLPKRGERATVGSRLHRSHSVWFMAIYSIDSDEWELVSYAEGQCPQPRSFPLLFAVEDTMVVTGAGSDTISTSGSILKMKPNVFPEDTWEWSLETRLWTEIDKCPSHLKTVGLTHGDCHHIYSRGQHIVYRGRETTDTATERERETWLREPCDIPHESSVIVPLFGERQLRIAKYRTGMAHNGVKCLYVSVSDNVAHSSLSYAPIGILRLSPPRCRDINRSCTVMLNPYTMLIVSGNTTLLVDIDPRLLGPEPMI